MVHDPPSGWYLFGTHAGWDHVPIMEFSDEVGDEDGLPLFERPISTITDVVNRIWIMENARGDADGVTWRIICDQWWVVHASCSHGEFEAASNGPLDLNNAFERLAEKFAAAHGGS